MVKEEILILVDKNDLQIGAAAKLETHKKGLLHRAFSVMIYNKDGELLIQRRADCKYHSAGLWANSCCGHPRLREKNIDAAKRRLYEEMGFSCELTKITEITYELPLDNGMFEHEYTHIFNGKYDGDMIPNPDEVSEYKWVNLEQLVGEIKSKPEGFVSWFRLYVDKYYSEVFV